MQENEVIEFKKSTSELKEAIISISSILNKHKKGELYFGINNKGNSINQTITDKTLRDISQVISNNIEPKIYPTIEIIKINNIDCIKVSFQGENQPYFAHGRAYKRVADEDKQLSAKELELMIIDKNKDKLRWDLQTNDKCKLNDISKIKVKQFLLKSGKKFDNLENSLIKLELIKDNKFLNCAIALFSKNPRIFFPNIKLRCAIFASDDTTIPIDMQEFDEDIFNLIDEAEKYIFKNIHTGMKLDGLVRVDIPEINKEALREAIINAFCHRDYWKYDSVNIAIFKNRIEVRSPGLLYQGLTIKKIRTEQISERRNEKIAELFHMVHYVEKWGRGISLILSKEPETEFKEVGSQFIVVFKRKKSFEPSSEKSSEKILTLIKANSLISAKELAINLKISSRAVEKHISKLKLDGRIRRVGSDKGGHWEVISK